MAVTVLINVCFAMYLLLFMVYAASVAAGLVAMLRLGTIPAIVLSGSVSLLLLLASLIMHVIGLTYPATLLLSAYVGLATSMLIIVLSR